MRPHYAMLVLLAAACGGGDTTGPDPDTPGQGSLLVTGGSMGPKFQNIYITQVRKQKHPVLGDILVNVPIKTYENVSQFWTYNQAEYLKTPVYDRNYPPCKFCE